MTGRMYRTRKLCATCRVNAKHIAVLFSNGDLHHGCGSCGQASTNGARDFAQADAVRDDIKTVVRVAWRWLPLRAEL